MGSKAITVCSCFLIFVFVASIFAFSASQNNGFLAYSDPGDIDDAILDDEVFEATDVSGFGAGIDITNVSPGVVVIAFENSTTSAMIKTFDIDSDGDPIGFVDSLVFDDADQNYIQIIKVSGDIFAILHSNRDGLQEIFIRTVEIADDGEIGDAVLATLQVEDDTGSSAGIGITVVSPGIVAVIYEDDVGPPNDSGALKTFSISDSGAITLVDSILYEASPSNHNHEMDITIATDDIFAIAHISNVNDGVVTTVDISKNGNIGKVRDKFTFSVDDQNDQVMNIVQISDGTVAVSYMGSTPDEGILKTFNIRNSGGISLEDTFVFEDDIERTFEMIKVSNNIVAIAYENDDDDDGIIKTIAIENDGTITGLIDTLVFASSSVEDPAIGCSSNGISAIAYDSGSGGGGGAGGGTVVTVGIEGSVCVSPNFSTSGGGGDSEQEYRTQPTFGLDHQTQFVMVQGGFTANGKVFDITNNFHTDFPKQAILVGQTNTFSAKAYAVHILNSVEFMFGIPEVGFANMAEAAIEVTIDRDLNIVNIRVVQNDNLIDPSSVSASAMMTQCKSGASNSCYFVTISARFNEAPLNDIFALKGTDFTRRNHLTFLNEGFTIFGDSLNPATTLMIAANVKGSSGLMEVTQIDKRNDIWVDESENEYERNSFGSFAKTTTEHVVRDDPMVKVMTRYNSNFDLMKQNELDKATAIFDSSLIQKELPDSYRILNGERSDKLQDPEVQLKLFIEKMRADEKLNQLMQMWYAKPDPSQFN